MLGLYGGGVVKWLMLGLYEERSSTINFINEKCLYGVTVNVDQKLAKASPISKDHPDHQTLPRLSGWLAVKFSVWRQNNLTLLLIIAVMNAELPPFKNWEHNSESTLKIDRVITPLTTFLIDTVRISRTDGVNIRSIHPMSVNGNSKTSVAITRTHSCTENVRFQPRWSCPLSTLTPRLEPNSHFQFVIPT